MTVLAPKARRWDSGEARLCPRSPSSQVGRRVLANDFSWKKFEIESVILHIKMSPPHANFHIWNQGTRRSRDGQ